MIVRIMLNSPLVLLLATLAIADKSDYQKRKPVPVDDDGHQTSFFGSQHGKEIMQKCPEGHTYDPALEECVPTQKRVKRQMNIGSTCLTNIDCGQSGMYCDSTRRCGCLTTYVSIGGSCWQKINPDEGGCTYSRQCSAVWPNSYCSNGQCKCANGKLAFQTNEGKICLNYDQCPTNSNNPIYIDTRTTGDANAVTCAFDNQCPPGYECFCSKENCSDTSTVKYCCPMRGLSCILNYDIGYGTGSGTTRWYHNPVTQNCETFNYRGNGGNSNHFETKEQCESYCQTYCKRGDPEITQDGVTIPAPGEGRIPKGIPKSCTVSTNCADTTYYECQTVGTNQYCCPKPDYVCAQMGGIIYDSTLTNGRNGALVAANLNGTGILQGPDTIFDAGIRMPNRESTSFARFYYNPGVKRCLPFTYYGQGGNLNHFMTQSTCESYCSIILCDAGEPLKDATGIENLSCTSGSGCPSSHTCSSKNVCCPTIQTVCSLAKAGGTCGNYVNKWWFNAQTGNCETFLYSGCQGNANRFDTYLDCQNFCRDANVKPKCNQGEALRDSYDNYIVCGGVSTTTACPGNYDCFFDGITYGCCPTVSYTCTQSYDQGTVCGPGVTRWYYNSAQRKCYSFEYYGCDGNPNNFATQTDCENFCGVGRCPDGGKPYKESNGAFRSCGGGAACPETHFCTQVTLGSSTTYNYCCPTKATVCSDPRDAGQQCTTTAITRYYFNVANRNCETFGYNGCGGNQNSFTSLNQCLNYCNSAGCPSGTIALKDATTGTLSTCDLQNANTCPSGYTCAISTLLNQNLCCGVPHSADRCPSGQVPYYDAYTNSELQCQANVVGNCPSGYGCYYSSIRQGYYCCGTAANRCPLGGDTYIEKGTSEPRRCTPGLTDVCPNGYSCQPTNINIQGIQSTTGYCCGRAGICADGAPQLVNNQPITCTVAANQCDQTNGFQCMLSSVNQVYYCCRPGVATAVKVCGVNQPYVISNAPVLCTQGTTSTRCPSPYTCNLYSTTNTFYCCQSGQGGAVNTGNATVCPPQYNPYLPTSVPGNYQYCSPQTANSCPSQNYCLLSNLLNRFICCGRANFIAPTTVSTVIPYCPGGQAVQNAGNNNPVTCQFGLANACTPGFSCLQSSNGQSYCCRTSFVNPTIATQPVTVNQRDPNGCPSGTTYLYDNTRTPLICFQGGNQCPAGYQCLPSWLYTGSFQCCSTGFVPVTQPSFTNTVRPTQNTGAGVNPGEFGCSNDRQCQAGGEPYARCLNGQCLCSSNLLVYSQRCVSSCPYPYRNVNGICVISGRARSPDDGETRFFDDPEEENED